MSANYSKRKSDNQAVSTPRRTRTDGNTRWDAAHNSMTYGPAKPSNWTNSSRERVSYFWPDISKRLEKFTFFWRADSPFSQHHPARFFLDGSTFNCSEQYYMYQKAATFRDYQCARKIMETSDPARQKSIAKGIPCFDQDTWDNISYDVVKKANIAKFGSNERLLNLLVATRGTELVEASPKDHKWGIGLEADRSEALRRITWRGENKLGKILTEIRDTEFKGVEYQPEKLLHDKLYGYIYFWRSSSPFSPKHLAPFKVENLSFVSLFHFLMFKSAELSGNKRTVDKITREMKQNIIEKEAYKIEINNHAWKLSMTGNLIEGNFYKFGDNPNLKALLLATNGKLLVFQSRFEGIGNGLEEEDSHDLVTSGDWRGTNLFGSILTFMRDEWIKKPNITLDELKSKELPSYNLKEIDLMHMKHVEPPPLKERIDLPQRSTAKPEDTENTKKATKKEEYQEMETSMWDSDLNKTATTETDSAANDSTKKKKKKKAGEEVEHESEEASCNKSELCKENEADDKLKKRLPSSSKDKKVHESQDIDPSDGGDDDKTEKPDEKSKNSKSQKKREDTGKEEYQKMGGSDSNKTATTKTNSAANDSTKKKNNKNADEEVERNSEEASCNKSELCKENDADDKLKKRLPSSSKDKKMQESQDMEIDPSGGDDDDDKTGKPDEKSKKSISQKKREKRRRQKERKK